MLLLMDMLILFKNFSMCRLRWPAEQRASAVGAERFMACMVL